MSKSLIQTANQSTVQVAENSIIPLGSVQRRYGCNLRLSGNAVECVGEGYYTIDCGVSVTPTAAGAVTVALYNNGQQIPGAIAYGTGTAGSPLALALPPATVRQMCCDSAFNITAVLISGAGAVNNIGLRVTKE